jgi:ATP/maltotriose-dependent transcriptional regulator MalT
VGREREQAALRECFDAAIAGRGGLVLIGGEAGIGKTALAESLCREAADVGALVLVGRCYDLTETPPYGPWVDLFATYTPGTNLPPLPAPFATRGTVGAVASQSALFTAVLDFFSTLSQQQPLVLLLDDLHWTDPTSLTLLRFLARALARLPLLLLVAYRADELTRRHPLYALLPLLERESPATRLDLRRLAPHAVHTLVAARYPLPDADRERLVAYLVHRAEGNAFFTLQLLRALAESDALRSDEGGWMVSDLARIHVPLALRQVIDGRLARLSEEAQQLLAVAAVIGQEVPLALWATVTERDEDALLAVVEPAAVARIVEETEDGTGVRFVHALIREALYEGLSAVRRRRLHAQVGEILIGTESPDPDAVVNHLRRAGDARLAEWLITAAQRAQLAHAEASAIARYEEALPLLAAPTPTATHFIVRYELATLLRFQRDGIAYAEEALESARRLSEPLLEAAALARVGSNRTYVESLAEGLVEQERAAALLARLPESETHWFTAYRAQYAGATLIQKATIGGFLAMTLALVGRFADAAELDVDAGFVAGLVSANQVVARVLRAAMRGDPAAARTTTRTFLEFMGTAGYIGLGEDYIGIGGTLGLELATVLVPYQADNAAEVRQVAAAAIAAWTQVGEGILGVPPHSLGLEALIVHGEWDEAWSLLLAVRGRLRTAQTMTLGPQLSLLMRARGQTEMAAELVSELLPAGPATEPGHAPFRLALGLQETATSFALAAGDLPGARQWLAAHDRWLAWSGAILGLSEGQALWAQYYRLRGDSDSAHQRAERALAHASEPRQPLALLAAHRLLGELATDAARFADAQSDLDAALALADACAAPYERALTLLALAELRLATGDTQRARTLLEDARAICARLGATPARTRADALLVHLSSLAAPTFPAGLSAREVEVLRLVAQGWTDRQVADHLFLSPRTVNQHLRSIYNKLGVSSRAAASAFAVQHGLAGQ